MSASSNGNLSSFERRWRGHRLPSAALAASRFTLCATLLSSATIASAATEPDGGEQAAATRAVRAVEQALDNLATLSSVSLEADVVVVFDRSLGPDAPSMPIGEPILGSFRYIASDEGWRKRSLLDPDKYPGMNVEVADDGEWYQYFSRSSGTLAIAASGPSRTTGMELPNPLLALGQFLVSPSEQADSVEVPFAEMRTRAAAFDSAVLQRNADGSLVFQTDVEEGLNQRFSIECVPEDPGLINVIDRFDDAGRLLTRTRFEHWAPADEASDLPGAAMWPRLVTFSAYDPATSEMAGSIQMSVSVLETGGLRIDPDEAFRLDWSLAENFWISEEEVFIR